MAEWAVSLAIGRALDAPAPRLREGLTMMRYDQSFFVDADAIG
jgi:hypothetical protein